MSAPDPPNYPSAGLPAPPPPPPPLPPGSQPPWPQYGYPAAPPTKRKIPVIGIIAIVALSLVALCCGGAALAIFLRDDKPDSSTSPTPTRRASQAPTTAPAEPLAPFDQFAQDLTNKLGRSNRGADRLVISDVGGVITVRIAFQSSITKGLVRLAARNDTLNVIRAAKSSGVSFTQLTVLGTFVTEDVYGNSQENQVVRATYSAATVAKINTGNIPLGNIYAAADSSEINPDF